MRNELFETPNQSLRTRSGKFRTRSGKFRTRSGKFRTRSGKFRTRSGEFRTRSEEFRTRPKLPAPRPLFQAPRPKSPAPSPECRIWRTKYRGSRSKRFSDAVETAFGLPFSTCEQTTPTQPKKAKFAETLKFSARNSPRQLFSRMRFPIRERKLRLKSFEFKPHKIWKESREGTRSGAYCR